MPVLSTKTFSEIEVKSRPKKFLIQKFKAGEKRFYKVGWNAGATYANTVHGYSGVVTTIQYDIYNSPFNSCNIGLAPLSMPNADANPFNVDDPQTFVVGATGHLYNSALAADCDQWKINHLKELQNLQVGL